MTNEAGTEIIANYAILFKNSCHFNLIIDLTILPLAPETNIDRYVLATKNIVNKIISKVTLS